MARDFVGNAQAGNLEKRRIEPAGIDVSLTVRLGRLLVVCLGVAVDELGESHREAGAGNLGGRRRDADEHVPQCAGPHAALDARSS